MLEHHASGNVEDKRAESLKEAVALLLQGIALHTIQGSPKDYAELVGDIDEISRRMATAEGADTLAQAGAVVGRLSEYCKRTYEYFTLRGVEWRKTVQMLMAALATISTAGQEHVEQLRNIEDELSAAMEVEEVRVIQSKLSQCLEAIRREHEWRGTRPAAAVAEPGRRTEAPPTIPLGPLEALPCGPKLDSVTGLPDRCEAEAALERAHRLGQPVSAGVIVLDSLASINSRYGRKAGDLVLQALGQDILSKLPPDEKVFRWSGPALVLLLKHNPYTRTIGEEFARVMKAKFEHTIQTSSRTIHLPVTKRWIVLLLTSQPAELFREIDNFVAPAAVEQGA